MNKLLDKVDQGFQYFDYRLEELKADDVYYIKAFMKYIQNRDNFNTFVENWSAENEYVLFGASKECVQFIRTMDYLLGPGKLKIKYIVNNNKLNKRNAHIL